MKKILLIICLLIFTSTAFGQFAYKKNVDDTTAVLRSLIADTSDTLRALIALKLDLSAYGDSLIANESTLEGILDLQDLQGAVTDGQVPDNITASKYLLLTAFIDSYWQMKAH